MRALRRLGLEERTEGRSRGGAGSKGAEPGTGVGLKDAEVMANSQFLVLTG